MTTPFIAGIARAGTRSAALSFAGLGPEPGSGVGSGEGGTHTHNPGSLSTLDGPRCPQHESLLRHLPGTKEMQAGVRGKPGALPLLPTP